MTLLSSGTLALQNAGTNSTTTSPNSLESDFLTRAQDGYVDVRCLYELPGGDNFSTLIEWKGQVGGWQSGTSVSTRWMSGSSLPILGTLAGTGVIDQLPLSSGTRSGVSTFTGEPTVSFGTIGGGFYTDGAGNTRTLRAIIFGNPVSSPSPNNTRHWVIFVLNGTSVPNSDNTFKSLILTGSSTDYTFTRSSAHYSSSSNGCTAWAWEYNSTTSNNGIDSMYTSGTSGFEIMGPDTTVTVNNGIAEEFGGADSSNVALSDYYRTPGGTLHNTVGIPTSGQIKFSDFLGKTKVDIQTAIMSATMTNGTDSGQYHSSNGFSGTSAIGSATGTSLSGIVGGQTGCTMSVLLNTNGVLYFQYIKSGYSGTFSNTGWTTLNVYLGQSNNSGSADLTLARTAFSFSSSNGIAFYTYNGSSPSVGSPTATGSGAIFGSSGGTHFIEIV